MFHWNFFAICSAGPAYSARARELVPVRMLCAPQCCPRWKTEKSFTLARGRQNIYSRATMFIGKINFPGLSMRATYYVFNVVDCAGLMPISFQYGSIMPQDRVVMTTCVCTVRCTIECFMRRGKAVLRIFNRKNITKSTIKRFVLTELKLSIQTKIR